MRKSKGCKDGYDAGHTTLEDSEQSIPEDSEQATLEDSEQSIPEDSEQSTPEDSEQVALEASKQPSGRLHTYSMQLDKEALCHEEVVHCEETKSALLELQSQISLPSNWCSQIPKDMNRLLFVEFHNKLALAQHHSR